MSLYWHFPIEADGAISSAPAGPATVISVSKRAVPSLGRLGGCLLSPLAAQNRASR